MCEQFQPPPHIGPDTSMGLLLFRLRLLIDFQVRTVYRDVKAFLKDCHGKLLDVGCGICPYRHLVLAAGCAYVGVDIAEAERFGYDQPDILHFDGARIPLPPNSVDCILCTEVLEHAAEPIVLIAEMHQVLKVGGEALITVPWSARNHYMPYDYHRFTPDQLQRMFSAFSSVRVQPRGTDLTVIAAKIIVVYARSFSQNVRHPIGFLIALLCLPLLPFVILAGHLSLLFRLGSKDDPLGYSIRVKK